MKKICYFLIIMFFTNCGTDIKNPDAKVDIEKGTEVATTNTLSAETKEPSTKKIESEKVVKKEELLGFWVGYFEEDDDDNKNNSTLYVDEGFTWTRENKINISIDKIIDSLVVGHSVVAGNDRPFKGLVVEEKGAYKFEVKEPGDDKYDGEFAFYIEDNRLSGWWKAYKKIEIPKRKYTLERKDFAYNRDIMLEESVQYVNWNKFIEEKETVVYDDGDEREEFDEWISREFASATNLIYKVNASNRLLTKSEVENLKKGDLTIIRNTIYARHGYSFKNRPLRVFFDAQSWYIPVHTNIKNDFTDLEKENIQLLLKYEKNAAEYYDYFGRG